MTPEQIERVRGLLGGERILALAVLVDNEPYAGLLPYAVAPDCGAVYVHASGLARHTRGLEQGAPFSVLIHKPDQLEADPLQIPRLTLQGTVDVIDRKSEEYREAKVLYLERFPSSEPTFMLSDFNLYRLRFAQGRYIGGFAQALPLSADDLRQLA
jgi:putative heme iron utilization protein